MTKAQLMASGSSAWQVRQLVASGQYVALRRGVFADAAAYAESESDPARRHAFHVLAARLVNHGMAASHESAALMQSIDLLKDPPDGVVTLTRRSARGRGSRATRNSVRVHAASLPAEHVTKCFGILSTRPSRTVVDLARSLPFMDAVVAADSALHKQKVSPAGLAGVLASCSGWSGTESARKVLEFADGDAESPLESCARVIFAREGLPPPRLQELISTRTEVFRVDFYWPEHNTISEADGLMKYDTPGHAIDQLTRDQLIREAGHKIVHFTWHQLFRSTPQVIAWHQEAFASPSPR